MIISRPGKNKYATVATTVNNALDDTGYTFLDSYQNDTSDSSKQVDTSKYTIKDTQKIKEPIKDTQTIKEPIIDDTHLVDRVYIFKMDPLIWTKSSPESESLEKEDLGLLAREAYPRAFFREGKV